MNYFNLWRYLQYHSKAKNAHHLHSPFLFNLYTEVFLNEENYYAFDKLSALRNDLLRNETSINFIEMGAGSKVFSGSSRRVDDIARHGITREKYAKLLFRIINYFKYEKIVELGTSLGLTTLYLAAPNSQASVLSIEGNPQLSEFAKNQADNFGSKNIEFVVGNFDDKFSEYLKGIEKIDFLFVDGNHRKEPTLNYFNQALTKKHNDTVFVFDDIHWSKEMEEAWEEIKNHPEVTVSIDLFQFGIVFFRRENKIKEDIVLKFKN
jgi:predicted O-methyltransferase YrrM